MDNSRCWPPAPRWRANSAAVMAWQAVYAVTLSHTRCLRNLGFSSPVPVWLAARPEWPWMTVS